MDKLNTLFPPTMRSLVRTKRAQFDLSASEASTQDIYLALLGFSDPLP